MVEIGIDKDLKRAGSAASRYEFFRLLLDDYLQTFERDAALWSKTNHSRCRRMYGSTIRLSRTGAKRFPAVLISS